MKLKKTVLLICRNHLAKAPRFLMEVRALREDFNLIAAGLSEVTGEDSGQFINIGKVKPIDFHYTYPYPIKKLISLFIRLFIPQKKILNYNFQQLKKPDYDLIIVHHFSDLELAVKLAEYKRVKVIFNAHEYYPLEFDNDAIWMREVHPHYTALAEKYLKKMVLCLCVGTKIAEKYKTEFGMDSKVITNAKRFYHLKPSPVIKSAKIKLVHHGNAMRSRKLELMIDLVKLLGDQYTLDLILVPGEEDYINELKARYESDYQVRFPEPVPVNQIPEVLNHYDIGLYILSPQNFNDNYALPNKFFEFIQARLAIAIAPSPEMKAIVEKYDLGVVADDFTPQALAEKIAKLSVEKIIYYKHQSHAHAATLSVEENEKIIKETVEEMIA